jgi:hypothetical protein
MSENLAKIAIAINVAVVVALVVLYNKNEDLQRQLHTHSANIENNQITLKDGLTGFGSSLEDTRNTVNSNEKRIRTNGDDIAALMAKLTNDVESKILSSIITQGANAAVKELAGNQSLVFSDQFKDEVANIISTKYVERLRGDPGVDANNEVIANLLRSDVDFLDRVSANAVLVE